MTVNGTTDSVKNETETLHGPLITDDVVDVVEAKSRRRNAVIVVALAGSVIAAVLIAGSLLGETAEAPNLMLRNATPSLAHPFGTDWLGRDMLARTLVGLRISLVIGAVAATVSSVIALTFGVLAGVYGGWFDRAVSWLIDLFMSLPHLVLLILIAFAAGGGMRGVIIAVATTHWPKLTRVLRGEARRVASSPYVQLSASFGYTRLQIARQHVLGHLVNHFVIGLVLLFPHAILHEAALSFLGLGLPPHRPAIGILLSDSMQYLSVGSWWLAVLPGAALLGVVKTIDVLGEQLRLLTDPRSVHE